LQVGELALLIELLGLNLEHPGLIADFLGLLAEGADRVDGRDDREHGEHRGGDGGDLARWSTDMAEAYAAHQAVPRRVALAASVACRVHQRADVEQGSPSEDDDDGSDPLRL
jgi:hypothetical protein